MINWDDELDELNEQRAVDRQFWLIVKIAAFVVVGAMVAVTLFWLYLTSPGAGGGSLRPYSTPSYQQR